MSQKTFQGAAPEPGRAAPAVSTATGEALPTSPGPPQPVTPTAQPHSSVVAGPDPFPNLAMGGTDSPGVPQPDVPFDPTQQLQESTFVATPSPTEPQLASDNAALNARVGELTQAMGSMKAAYDRQIQEMRLQQQAAAAAARPAAQPAPAPQLPQGVDPNSAVTAQDLYGILNNMLPYVDARAMRSTWDVTPTEEQAALAAYPYLNNTPEPDRTMLIKDAALLLRETAKQTASSSNAPTPGQATAATPSTRTTRAAERTVPYVEHNVAAPTADLRPTTGSANIAAEYEAAKRIENPKQRLAAMKQVMMKAQEQAGMPQDTLAKSSFTMKS